MGEADKNFDEAPKVSLGEDGMAAAGDIYGEDIADMEDLPIANEGEELDALRAERDDMRDRFMRALADAENARKRGERDRREAEQYGGS